MRRRRRAGFRRRRLRPVPAKVWEVQASEDRAYVPGSIVAFVNGVHVMVVDGDRVLRGHDDADDGVDRAGPGRSPSRAV